MSLPADDRQHLERAIGLARSAVGLASPNPTVGCVLARGETVLGEGAHLYDARDHAEIVALKQAASLRQDVHGSTAYVTLEPCAHHGRTGPCSDALIAAGIARCVIATIDPNPLVRGQGAAKLRTAGVEVDLLDSTSPLAQAARRLNDAFAFSIQHDRPFVTLKAAASLDGFLAPTPASRTLREPLWLTGPAARTDVQQLRHASDAILTGIGTVLADNPALTDRSGLHRRRPLLRVVLDTQLRTPLNSKLLNLVQDDILILCAEQALLQSESLLRSSGAQVVRIASTVGNRLDLPAALKALHHRGIRSVMLEGGSALNGSFLAAGLVDRVVLYTNTRELGPGSIPFAEGQPSPFALAERLTSVQRLEIPHSSNSTLQDTRRSGYLHDPWAGVS
jgi:diaminohydroxyphosphoribosylaminopyrimidine deaminase/5-amino-6-(5-phosphoribosylamino)uracil reductase